MVGNKILAEAVGIRTEQLARNTFMVGTAWAGVAGALIAPLTPVEPYMGLSLIVDSFFALVVGGMGTISGLLAGSSVIGGVQSLGAANLDPTWAYLLMLIISIIFLWQKPRGIFPRT
jgi:branched-chain amino acid transport system permease protein/urea transport system permease protein